ncbi:MAG: SDR family oxidoreductase [archaeon]
MKKAIVTGGSGGIGKTIAKALHDNGFEVTLIARSEENLIKAAADVGENATTFPCDITDYSQIEPFFNKLKTIDVLVNCAGILGPTEPLEHSDLGEWISVIQTNLIGTVNCCKAAIPKLERSGRGKIINIAGGGAAYARPLHSAYATSKAAVVRFSEALALELKNTDVNIIAPGAHKTKMWVDETVEKEPENWANPEDVAKLVLFLASEKSNGITGKFIHIKDDYTSWTPKISKSDLYSLRRIDERLLESLKK